MIPQCGFMWVSPMRQEWVRCEHTTAPHNRHENGQSFVTTGCEDLISIPHRWVNVSLEKGRAIQKEIAELREFRHWIGRSHHLAIAAQIEIDRLETEFSRL